LFKGIIMKTITKLTISAAITASLLGLSSAASAFTACQVTDIGGVDDKGFNATAWKGVQDAVAKHGIDSKLLESNSETDYVPHLNSFVAEGCDVIVSVGFLMGEAIANAANENPGTNFSIVDFAYDPTKSNVVGQVFATDQAAFLAGYLAAGVSKTGIVGTFGGLNIPPVTVFMDGFAAGVNFHNSAKGTNVQVLGWDSSAQEGLFTGNFNSLDDGRAFARNLYDEGADIVMPVAGPVSLGSAALASELGTDNLKIIGVDADQYYKDAKNKSVYLTTVMKAMDATVLAVIESVLDGSFEGGLAVGTLENNGVGIAPFHDLAGAVSSDLAAEVEALRAGIIDGSVSIN
jgi:basic membrane protein A